MWPPQSVNTWPTPASRRTRATSPPPVRSAMDSPELLPLDALAIEAFRHEHGAYAGDQVPAARDIGDEVTGVGDDCLDGRRQAARSLRHDRMIGEIRPRARERDEVGVVGRRLMPATGVEQR